MNKKVSLGVAVSLIAVACAITFVLTMTVSLNMYNSMVAGVQERGAINSKIKEIDSFVRSSSIYSMDETDILNGIMQGYLSGIDDKYAAYYTADEYYKQQQTESGVIIGTGIETVINGDYLEVSKVYEGSSAYVEEVKKGDKIIAVDKKSLLEIGTEKAQKMLDGEEGTKINITLQGADEAEKNVTLLRQTIKLQSVKSQLIDGYAYIKISTFNSTTGEQFIQQIDKFEAQSVLGYIFDVRDCDTGVMTPLNAMLNRVLPKAAIAVSVDKEGTKSVAAESEGLSVIDKPITVLVNNKTACVAEVFAAGMRDYGNASLVGTNTAGKSELQTTQSFKDGSAVKVTTARIQPAESEGFDEGGLKPDYIVELNAQQAESIKFADPQTDSQLQKALETIVAI